MTRLIYHARASLAAETYTHGMLATLVRAALERGLSLGFDVPDEPEVVLTLLRDWGLTSGQLADVTMGNRAKPGESDVGLFAGSVDYWRHTITRLGRRAGGKRLYWLQGMESAESYLKHGSRLRRMVLSCAERLAVATSAATIVPSAAMDEELRRSYPELAASKIVIIPNLVDGVWPRTGAEYARWGLAERPSLALGYSGSLAQWQCFAETCAVVAETQRRVEGCVFLVLSRDCEAARREVNRHGIQNAHFASVDRNRVAEYIAAFDLGFMLRQEDTVNRVACPVKWLEYWRCGVPLVTTEAVSIVNAACGNEHNLKVPLNDPSAAGLLLADFGRKSLAERYAIAQALQERVRSDWIWAAWRTNIDAVASIMSCANKMT